MGRGEPRLPWVQLSVSIKASALGTPKVGDRVALMVSVYNGRSIGTR